ncbi:helix-turn-helix transcriptional regulator [Actinoplanes sp. NPDC023714]|uniref:helix-turn-helix domain-containing protein n=1 Tax=Actinoplanes sp. NPDC023714 TaxID=3154322 RepID=UPI0033DFBF86
MARRCGLAQSTVAKLRAGRAVPPPDRVLDLARALGMPAGDLLAIAGLPQSADPATLDHGPPMA